MNMDFHKLINYHCKNYSKMSLPLFKHLLYVNKNHATLIFKISFENNTIPICTWISKYILLVERPLIDSIFVDLCLSKQYNLAELIERKFKYELHIENGKPHIGMISYINPKIIEGECCVCWNNTLMCTNCMHYICNKCIKKVCNKFISSQCKLCPMCRQYITHCYQHNNHVY